MQSRGPWIRTDNIETANLVWTQWKERDFIRSLERLKDKTYETTDAKVQFKANNRRVNRTWINR